MLCLILFILFYFLKSLLSCFTGREIAREKEREKERADALAWRAVGRGRAGSY